MINAMIHTIQKHQMIAAGDTVVVGLSGGADSLAMTHALNHLKAAYGIKLIAVHVNHMLRGDMADGDESYVKAFCEAENIPFRAFRINVTEYAKTHGCSFEEAGRKIRYDIFEQVLNEVGGHKIAIGQNQNDVTETFFINLFRGAGVDGLASIEYVREGKIIRPLLDIPRTEIEAYCQTNHLMPRQDHTNQENHYVRNRIRNELLPYIKTHFNPGFQETLSRSIQTLKEERAYWEERDEYLFRNIHQIDPISGAVGLPLSALKTCHDYEQMRLLRHAIKKVRGHLNDLSYERFQSALSLNRTGTRVLLDKGHQVLCQYDTLWIQKQGETTPEVALPRLIQNTIKIQDFNKKNLAPNQVALDAACVSGAVSARFRRPGDRFIPSGMKGHKKLKDFFIDEKIPLARRDEIVLICDEEKILCLHGLRVHEYCKITENTKNILIITLEPVVQR